MGYTSISITYNAGTLCEEISFTEPGEQSYVLGAVIPLADSRLSRDRSLVVRNVSYSRGGEEGLFTTVSGFSLEYIYGRKSPDCDISFFTMTALEQETYNLENPTPDSEVLIMIGDIYGVGGWSMHSIVKKIAGWMGLSIINNLPDYWIGDFSISLGSTFFESITGLISVFEPLITLSGGVLYILERGGVGTLGGNPITPVGFVDLTVDKEYVPTPGCIKVEGQEGKYIASKDPAGLKHYWGPMLPDDKRYSGTVVAPNGATEEYSIIEKYDLVLNTREEILIYKKQASRLTDPTGFSSYAEITLDYEYNEYGILIESVETCKAEISKALRSYDIISTVYEHDIEWALLGQMISKKELFVYDSNALSYVKYDPRDYNLADLAEYEELVLIDSEIRTTRYSEIDSETYGVETIIASKAYNTELDEWETLYTFEHDIVEAGGQQRNSRGSRNGGRKTLQVYAGDCPILSDLSVMEEPPTIFNVPTSDWDSIEDCYVYLAALISCEFQKATASMLIIDPLPLMSIGGIDNTVGGNVKGNYYVKGYTINIDPNEGYTTSLEMEGRSA